MEAIRSLDEAKLGDKYMRRVRYGWNDSIWSEVAVESITKTTVTLKGQTYRKRDAMPIGSADGGYYMVLFEHDAKAIKESEERIERIKLLSALNEVDWSQFTLKELKEVKIILEQLVGKRLGGKDVKTDSTKRNYIGKPE